MTKVLTKIVTITILLAVTIYLSWTLYSINKSNREIPKSSKLVENVKYNLPQRSDNL